MLDYEWGNPSAIMLPGEEPDPTHHHHGTDPTRQGFLDHYGSSSSSQAAFNGDNSHHFMGSQNHHRHDLASTNDDNNSSAFANHLFNANPTHHHNHHGQSQPLHHSLFDPRAYVSASTYAPPSILSLEAAGSAGGPPYMLIPKSEDSVGLCRPLAADLIGSSTRIGLNLGGRTYFSSAEDDFVSRLYRRPRTMEVGSAGAANSPRCQAEGCNADLCHAKHYHRRHKVCEFHSKASTVIASGLTQRFCQQCSRFHLLSEFDNGKRSCRKRLADHNRRRRKTQQQPNQDNPKPSSSQLENNSRTNNPSSDHSAARSPPDSGAQSSSSVTVAVSPPRMLLDCFRQRSTYQTSASSGSSNSLFFSSG